MIRTGEALENPVTGEPLTFHRTSKDSGGESVLVETLVQPDGFVAAERFELLALAPVMPWSA
jgi:hypothetical protein